MPRHTPRARLSLTLLALGALIALSLLPTSCNDDIPEEAFQNCAVLSSVQKSSGGSISGNESMGALGGYEISGSASSSASVTPPADTPCAREIASRLQGLCAVCEQGSEAACASATADVFDIAKTPIEACAACGDGVCSAGETAREGEEGYCPQDCEGNCGDGFCDNLEQDNCDEDSPPECVACPQDCTATCGDGTCQPSENFVDCPVDCAPPCGDGTCSNGEQCSNPDAPLYCVNDCCSSTCGDSRCQDDENPLTCADDCTVCGDGICSEAVLLGSDEQARNVCAIDCDTCGDDICGRSEVATEEEADPDNEDPLRRKVVCATDCQ